MGVRCRRDSHGKYGTQCNHRAVSLHTIYRCVVVQSPRTMTVVQLACSYRISAWCMSCLIHVAHSSTGSGHDECQVPASPDQPTSWWRTRNTRSVFVVAGPTCSFSGWPSKPSWCSKWQASFGTWTWPPSLTRTSTHSPSLTLCGESGCWPSGGSCTSCCTAVPGTAPRAASTTWRLDTAAWGCDPKLQNFRA
jgi:hypothetical protein